MAPRRSLNIALAIFIAFMAAGCSRDTRTLEPAPASTDPVVFTDNFSPGMDYQAFLNSKVDAVQIDTQVKHGGTASLRVTVPGPDDPSGWFAGGAFTTSMARNLTGYDAVTFWAKASKSSAILNVVGLGNDNTGTSKYEAWVNEAIFLTTEWQKYIVPIPLPAKLGLEQGLFYFAEGYETDNIGYEIWFDDIIFEKTGLVTDPRPALDADPTTAFIGAMLNITGTSVTFDVDGTDMTVEHLPGYFTFSSSADTVAQVLDSTVKIVGSGSATITGMLGTMPADGELVVTVADSPTTPAPPPTVPAEDVISVFSNAYDNIAVETFLAPWSVNVEGASFQIDGDDIRVYLYSGVGWAGIDWAPDSARTIDATEMTHFHIDVWVPEGTGGFKVKLVDFGPDGVYTTGAIPSDISQRELIFHSGSTPPLVTGEWFILDIPLESFMNGPEGMFSRAHLAQLVISANPSIVFVDNIYFYRATE
jgi:hypothetical protein